MTGTENAITLVAVMESRAFITDLDTALGAELARLYLESGGSVFGTVSTRLEDDPVTTKLGKLKDSVGESLRMGLWNRHSPVSAKNMLLQARGRSGPIDTFVVIGNPVDLSTTARSGEVRVLSQGVDSWIKGNLYMLREILRLISDRDDALLTFVCLNRNHPESLLEETVRQALLGAVQSLLKRADKVKISAFESDADLPQDFAAYIFRNLSERSDRLSGKMMRFGKGFLSSLAAVQKS